MTVGKNQHSDSSKTHKHKHHRRKEDEGVHLKQAQFIHSFIHSFVLFISSFKNYILVDVVDE
jgi:hypothetical protein